MAQDGVVPQDDGPVIQRRDAPVSVGVPDVAGDLDAARLKLRPARSWLVFGAVLFGVRGDRMVGIGTWVEVCVRGGAIHVGDGCLGTEADTGSFRCFHCMLRNELGVHVVLLVGLEGWIND